MALSNVNTIMLDMARDMWGYISLGYFKLKVKSTEVGSRCVLVDFHISKQTICNI
jgi:adenylosuccinate lyase